MPGNPWVRNVCRGLVIECAGEQNRRAICFELSSLQASNIQLKQSPADTQPEQTVLPSEEKDSGAPSLVPLVAVPGAAGDSVTAVAARLIDVAARCPPRRLQHSDHHSAGRGGDPVLDRRVPPAG